MSSHTVLRRDVLAGGIAAAATATGAFSSARAAEPLTAGAVIARMQQHIGVPWKAQGVDGFKAGAPETVVRGIGTTMMATFDALKSAARQGLNMVVTHEPTYWSHPDTLTQLQDDPLYRKKLAFLRAHDMVSFHFHDNWHALKPVDGIDYGTQQLMGWTQYMHADNQRLFTLPPTTLGALAADFAARMGARTMRVVGDPALPVRTVYESWGYCSAFPGITFFDQADVLVIGEAQDWDLVAYAQDLVAMGEKKALIILGHVKSEQWGMRYCADWLKGFVPEVPVRFVPIIEPYWNLDRPALEIDTKGWAA
jgi:putative NIF3 family GTP cyclohydrolase 1 type 2